MRQRVPIDMNFNMLSEYVTTCRFNWDDYDDDEKKQMASNIRRHFRLISHPRLIEIATQLCNDKYLPGLADLVFGGAQ